MIGISGYSTQPSIDILIESLLQQERKPITALESRKSTLNSRLSVYNELKTKLKTLKDLVYDFGSITSSSKLDSKVGVSSDASIFTAEVTSDAEVGVHSLFVSQLAKRDTVISMQIDPDDTSGASKYNGTTQEFSITVGDDSTVTISLDFTDPNETNESILNRIATVINNSSAEVTASVIENAVDSVKLSIVSNEAGSINQLVFEDLGSSDLLNTLEIVHKKGRVAATDTGGGYIEKDVDKLNAIIELNGIQITKYKNEIDDVLEGVTLKLLKSQEEGEAPETLTISQDKVNVKEEIESFIEAYNEVIKYLNDKTGVNASQNFRGELAGNFAFLNLKLDLRTIASSYISGLEEGNPNSLTNIGITIEKDGTLKLDDEDKFNQAIEKGTSVIPDIFNSENGIGTLINETLEDFVSVGGKIDGTKKSIKRQISSIDTRIESYNTRIYIRELALRRELADMQKMLSALNSQQIMLQNSGILNLSGLTSSGSYATGGAYY